jgi:hypothetical protein
MQRFGAEDKSRRPEGLHAGPVDAHKSPKCGELETSVFCLFRGRCAGGDEILGGGADGQALAYLYSPLPRKGEKCRRTDPWERNHRLPFLRVRVHQRRRRVRARRSPGRAPLCRQCEPAQHSIGGPAETSAKSVWEKCQVFVAAIRGTGNGPSAKTYAASCVATHGVALWSAGQSRSRAHHQQQPSTCRPSRRGPRNPWMN